MEEPTDNLSGTHCSRSRDYGGPAGTFDQEQGEDMMSSRFLLSESQSPPSWLWLSLPPAEGFSRPENFGRGHISEMPCIPAAVGEETNYAAAPASLVATHGTGPGQFSSNFSLSSTKSDEFDEEEVQEAMNSLLHLPMAPDVLSNTTNAGPAERIHADAVPPLVQQDELPHPQQQLSLPMNHAEAQPGGAWAWPELSLVEEVQIQQMALTILPSQSASLTPTINPDLNEANHTASVPMGSQARTLAAAPRDQEANTLSTASTRRRPIKSRNLPSGPQDGSGYIFVMGIDMIREFGRNIGKMMKEEDKQISIVWQHFRMSQCKYCYIANVTCQYCNTIMRSPSAIEMLRHLESRHKNIQLLPVASRASKETQRSSQALQIKEIDEIPSGESEPVVTDNNNCDTAAQVGTPGSNTVALSCPCQLHELLTETDRGEQMASIVSSQLCCPLPDPRGALTFPMVAPRNVNKHINNVPDSWWDLVIRLSDSSYCSSTTKSTHDGFRLEFSNSNNETGRKIVHVQSSAACMHVRENPYEDQNHATRVVLLTFPRTIGSSYVALSSVDVNIWKSAPAWCTYPWRCVNFLLCKLGFRQEFARDLVIYALGWVDGCNLRLRSPSSSVKGKSIIVEQGDASSSGKRKRKPLPPRSKVWNHFTKEVVEAEGGSMVTMARCKHCGSELKAGSASHGTTHLARHIRSRHPEHAESL